MKRVKTVVQAIHFLLSVIGKADKLKIVKLLFLADKYHLNLYGRTITNDNYVAMLKGPVGSLTKDVLGFEVNDLSSEEIAYAGSYITRIGRFEYEKKSLPCQHEMLSDSDRNAISYIADKFKHLNSWELVALSHLYPEWEKHESTLSEETRSVPMDINDLFSYIDSEIASIERVARENGIDKSKILPFVERDPIRINEEHMRISKEILNGAPC